jgi:iron(III) transport system ATP-binding protein
VVPPERRQMGMVFQNYAVWPHKTVFENVAFGLQIRRLAAGEVRARVAKMLELVGLGGFERRLPSALSGGQQQRVALARSLVVEPSILLLDEPLSNLDAKLRERMRVELKQIQRRTGITFVYVTHDQAEALALSDDIAVIDGGRLQQFGPPREVYARPANRIVADFMGQVSFLPARVASAAAGEGEVTLDGGGTLALALPPGVAAGDAVEIAVRPENVRIAPAGRSAGGMLAGTVVEHTYLGNTNEYVVAAASGARLRVQTHPGQLLAVGEAVAIEFDAGHCTVFPKAVDDATG